MTEGNGQIIRTTPTGVYDVVVVGAGFGGLYMLHRLRGLGLRVRVFDAAPDVGGTWYWNCYPGARCDVESVEYSYSFDGALQEEWVWTERYAAQPEILAYLRHVADRFDLRRDIQLETRITSAHFDETAQRWNATTDRGHQIVARYLVMATGGLSSANTPDFPGIGTFAGESYHTGRWPHETVDFTDKRVGVIGTGSSGIQAIPMIAQQAAQLFVFQRTPAYTVPARNRPLTADVLREVKATYRQLREENRKMPGAAGSRRRPNPESALDATPEERQRRYQQLWEVGGPIFMGAYGDILTNVESNEIAAEFVRSKIREIVHDPAVAELLSPHTLIGCKRMCFDTDYYATYNRPNVTLVDVRTNPIERVTPKGLVTGGVEYELDAIVFATGFDALTGALLRMDVRGRGGLTLKDAWRDGPRTHLGLMVPGFPNLFTISGPGSPSVLTNMATSIEQHVEWISDCIEYLDNHGDHTIEATPAAASAWVEHVNAVADTTLYPQGNSWYLGSNIPGKPRVFMPLLGFPQYAERCDAVAAKGYRDGFLLDGVGDEYTPREGPTQGDADVGQIYSGHPTHEGEPRWPVTRATDVG